MAINPRGVFEYFDPLEGELPTYHTHSFEYIVFMARKYLEGKSSSEIVSIYKLISKLYEETDARVGGLERLIKQIEAEENGLKNTVQPFTDSQHLLNCWNKYRKEGKVLDGVKWSELFSAQALAFVSLAVSDEIENNPNDEELEDWDLYDTSNAIAYLGFDAMESIGYATMCYAIENNEVDNNVIDALLSRKVKDRNKKAIQARHSKVNTLKDDFMNYYNNGVFKSRADAARRFYENLSADRKKLLVPTNAVRTLTQALPKVKR